MCFLYLNLNNCSFNDVVILFIERVLATTFFMAGMHAQDINLEVLDHSVEQLSDSVCGCGDWKNSQVLWLEWYDDTTQFNITYACIISTEKHILANIL